MEVLDSPPPAAAGPRPPRRRDDRQRRDDGAVRRRGRPRHAASPAPSARRARSSSPSSRTSPPTRTTQLGPAPDRRAGRPRWRRSASRDHRFLGGAGPLPRLRDDGPADQRPAGLLLAGRPRRGRAATWSRSSARCGRRSLVTYDENGGYGHPDHIQAHRVAMRGVELAADPSFGRGEPWEVAKVYWNAMPEIVLQRRASRALREAGDTTVVRGHGPRRTSCRLRRCPTTLVTTAVDAHGPRRGEDGRDARARHPDHRGRAVLRAVEQPRQRGVGRRVLPAGPGSAGTERDADGRETDLFAGIVSSREPLDRA